MNSQFVWLIVVLFVPSNININKSFSLFAYILISICHSYCVLDLKGGMYILPPCTILPTMSHLTSVGITEETLCVMYEYALNFCVKSFWLCFMPLLASSSTTCCCNVVRIQNLKGIWIPQDIFRPTKQRSK